MVRTRPVQNADRAALEQLLLHAQHWESGAFALDRVVELDGRLVAAARGSTIRIAPPQFVAEPVPHLQDLFTAGAQLAYVGAGLVVMPELDVQQLTMIHRLMRTLPGEEAGARWCLVAAAIPQIAGFEPAGVVQQISAGAIDHDPITIPMRDGYWPIGIYERHAVLVRRNEAF